MAAITMGHLICTSALVTLLFVMPLFFTMVTENIQLDIMQKEMKEIADYVSNTLANLYFLVNSTDNVAVSLEKELIYLPPTVENARYILKIDGDGVNASKITTQLKERSSIAAKAWLVPGLKMSGENSIESSEKTVVVGCGRNNTGVYVWLKHA